MNEAPRILKKDGVYYAPLDPGHPSAKVYAEAVRGIYPSLTQDIEYLVETDKELRYNEAANSALETLRTGLTHGGLKGPLNLHCIKGESRHYVKILCYLDLLYEVYVPILQNLGESCSVKYPLYGEVSEFEGSLREVAHHVAGRTLERLGMLRKMVGKDD